MGSCISAQTVDERLQIAWGMPSWAIKNYEVDDEVIRLISSTWQLLCSGAAPPFDKAKQHDVNLTPVVFFFNTFYSLLFEMAPEAKPLFKRGIAAQGRMLTNVLQHVLSNLTPDREPIFKEALVIMTKFHNKLGIVAAHYSLMGTILLHSVRLCIGETNYTPQVQNAWVQVYSKIMAVVIPVVVTNELPKEGESMDELIRVGRMIDYKKGAEVDSKTKVTKSDGSGFTSTESDVGSDQPSTIFTLNVTTITKTRPNRASSETQSAKKDEVMENKRSTLSPKSAQNNPTQPTAAYSRQKIQQQQQQRNRDSDDTNIIYPPGVVEETAITPISLTSHSHAKANKYTVSDVSGESANTNAASSSHSTSTSFFSQRFAHLEKALKVVERMERDVFTQPHPLTSNIRCFSGEQALQYLTNKQLVTSVEEAGQICNVLMVANCIRQVDPNGQDVPITLQGCPFSSSDGFEKNLFNSDYPYYRFCISKAYAGVHGHTYR